MKKVICCNIFDKNNDKMYLKIKNQSTLIDLRNALEKRRQFNSLLFLKSNGNYYSKEEEKLYIFKFTDNLVINFAEVEKIKIYLDKKFLCDIKIKNIPLNKLRIQLGEKINPQHKFSIKKNHHSIKGNKDLGPWFAFIGFRSEGRMNFR